jgi:hypothetical protein
MIGKPFLCLNRMWMNDDDDDDDAIFPKSLVASFNGAEVIDSPSLLISIYTTN